MPKHKDEGIAKSDDKEKTSKDLEQEGAGNHGEGDDDDDDNGTIFTGFNVREPKSKYKP